MRYSSTLKLSTRMVTVVTMIVVTTIFLLFIGGSFSIKKLGDEYMHQTLRSIVQVVDDELAQEHDPAELRRWIPKLLKASGVIEFEIRSESLGTIFEYRDTTQNWETQALYGDQFSLVSHPGYVLEIKLVPPYVGYSYSVGALSSFTFAIFLIIFCLYQGVKWLQRQLLGTELLEERGKMLLAGRVEEYAKGDAREWPYTASEALDRFIQELSEARKERSRFDTFLRENTFLDKLTGSANRMMFDSKLQSTLLESDATGAIAIIEIYEWEELKESLTENEQEQLLLQLDESIKSVFSRYDELLVARYFDNSFALLLPRVGHKDISQLLNQLLNTLDKIKLSESIDKENWVHFGLTMYRQGESRGRLVEEATTALKSAQLQSSNNWSRFDKQHHEQANRGSVRWRQLFDKQVKKESIQLFSQRCFIVQEGQREEVHQELFARIFDENNELLKASQFYSALAQVGYEAQFDIEVLQKVTRLMNSESGCYSVNLSALPFRHRSHQHRFRDYLLTMPPTQRRRLSFEFIESDLVAHLDFMRPVLKLISAVGAKNIVHQVGRTIVSTYYLKEFDINYLKLHRGIVREIDRRPENQLVVRSLLGACNDSDTEIIAVGVEKEREWAFLSELGVKGVQGRLYDTEQLKGSQTERILHNTKVQVGRRNRWRKK